MMQLSRGAILIVHMVHLLVVRQMKAQLSTNQIDRCLTECQVIDQAALNVGVKVMLLLLLLLVMMVSMMQLLMDLVGSGLMVAICAYCSHYLHPFSSITLVHRTKLVSAATHSVGPNSFELHSNVQTLLKAAIRASFSLWLVYVTSSICDARVDLLILHSSLEETLAAFTSE